MASGGLATVRLAEAAAGLRGWRRAGAAIVLGAIAALALPPIYLVPVLLFSFPILIVMLDGCTTGRSAFATGWCFGFGHHLVGLYWIANALLVDAGNFAWLIPVVCGGLPAAFALLIGAATLAAWRWGGRGTSRVLAFAVAWAAFEWLRGHLFTGFPWNLLGYIWSAWGPMLQVTALIGIYGLTLLTVLAAAAPAALAGAETRQLRSRLWIPALAWSLLVVAGIGGAARLWSAPSDTVDGVRLRIVQANIPQQMKWEVAQRLAIFRKHLELSARPGETPTHIIWPETAVPFFLANEQAGLQAIADLLPPASLLLTGSPRGERDANGQLQLWNSLLAIGSEGNVLATYDKFHLVPLGEYVPLRRWLNLAKVTPGAIDFTPGTGPHTLSLPATPPFSALICYEVIFPGAVVGEQRPAWLLNITNDAWYGRSAGPHQHFQIARVRAVEEGLPLIRAANTGISAVVDAYGRISARLDLNETGIIDSGLPKAAVHPTLYSRVGDLAFLALIAAVVAAAFLTRNKPHA